MNPLLPFPHNPDYAAAAWLPTAGTATALAALQSPPPGPLLLVGGPATGKTHLLSIAAARHPHATVVDDVHALTPAQQTELFHTFNRLQQHNGLLLMASRVAPAQLNTPESPFLADLQSRLATALLVDLKEPTEPERRALILKWSADRQLTLPPAVLSYIITHASRNLADLHSLIARLDALSLETQRPLTIPLLKLHNLA